MNNKRGFTLIELLAVIIIIGLLISLLTNNILNASDKTKTKLNKIMVANLKDAAVIYAKDKKLKDCHNCSTYSLNVDCITADANIEVEKASCEEKGINVSLGLLKSSEYFNDPSGHCYLYDTVLKKKVLDENINIRIYRYDSDYIIDIGDVECVN